MIIANYILKFIVLVFITFFTCQIITDGKKRISYIGTLLICFSTAIIEYIGSGLVEAIVTGELILLAIHNILYNSSKMRYVYIMAIFAGIAGFFLLSNISFQISIGIAILTLILWKILDAKNDSKIVKLSKKEKCILLIGLFISFTLSIVLFEYSPVQTLENRNGICYLSSYTYDEFIVFDRSIGYEQSGSLATFISVFPMAIVIGIWYIFKEETKHLKFIVPTVIVSILELIFIFLNKTIAFLPNYILVLGFNLLQIYMLIYIFARIEIRLFSLIKAAYIAIAGLVLFVFIPVPAKLSKLFTDFTYLFYTLEAYIVLNYSDRRFWKLASWVFTIICLFDFVTYTIVKIV